MNELDVTTRMPDDVRLRALMRAYQAGDLQAFDELYGMLMPAVRRFLRRHSRDGERVNDLVQETFLQIHRARHTYDAAYPAIPWVLAIARHVWLMHLRASGRRPQANVDLDTVPLPVRADAASYAERHDLHAALDTLTAERRRPLLWHHVWGLSFREIAARLGIREDAAKLRSSRAMGELRSRLHGAREKPR
jgi:RNA polymerase sigma-70 factor, ECF subfamily